MTAANPIGTTDPATRDESDMLPADSDAERCLLGLVMAMGDASRTLVRSALIRPAVFHREDHAAVWLAVECAAELGLAPGPYALCAMLLRLDLAHLAPPAFLQALEDGASALMRIAPSEDLERRAQALAFQLTEMALVRTLRDATIAANDLAHRVGDATALHDAIVEVLTKANHQALDLRFSLSRLECRARIRGAE